MSILDPIRAAVAAMSSVTAGAIAVLTDLHERLVAALADDDLEAVQEIADQLDAQKSALAGAIAANTVAAPDAPNPDLPANDMAQPAPEPAPTPEPEPDSIVGDIAESGTVDPDA